MSRSTSKLHRLDGFFVRPTDKQGDLGKLELRFTPYALASEGSKPPAEQVKRCLTEIGASRRRARKTQTQINRLKKKTQAILDKLQ